MAPNDADGVLANVDADALSIPRANELAAFLRAGHDERARLVNCWQSSDGSAEWLEIEVFVSVPQRPVHDIRSKEGIVVGFASDEQFPPGVYSLKTRFSVRSAYESAIRRGLAKPVPLRPIVA